MSLISRKAAIDRLNAIPPGNWSKARYTRELWNVPSVPAVPLDKLCEWLGKEGMLAPCYFNQDCDECELKSYWRHKKSECWKQCLTKWMEEQDADRE